MSLTRPLDPIFEPLAVFFGYRPEDISIGFGTGAIEKIIEIIEDKFAKGWWKVFLYSAGSLGTLFLGGKSADPRTKLESAIIGTHLATDLAKIVVEEWDEIQSTIAEFADAVARGDLEAALNTMVKTDALEGIMTSMSGCGETEIAMPTTQPIPIGSPVETVKARG